MSYTEYVVEEEVYPIADQPVTQYVLEEDNLVTEVVHESGYTSHL